MAHDTRSPQSTLALNTKVEQDFVAPLTAVRGSLEILRDIRDLSADERARFVQTALRGVARLEKSIGQLAETVYAAGQKGHPDRVAEPWQTEYRDYARRIHFDNAEAIVEIDLSGLEFSTSKMVNTFFSVVEEAIEGSGRDWYLIANYTDVRIWPEAWVAFAHCFKRIVVNHALGTARYAAGADGAPDSFDSQFLTDRAAARAAIADMKARR